MAKPKHVSRANRAANQAGEWRSLSGRLTALLEENDPEDVPEELKDHFAASVLVDAKSILENFETSELSDLTEEMENWRDSIPENLHGGDKYQAVEDAVSTLENISEEAPVIENWDSIQEAIDDLDSRADELESIEFPGMFG